MRSKRTGNPICKNFGSKTDQNQPTDGREHYIQMDGQEVYRFATRRVPQCIEEALSDAGLTVPDIDMFVLHQANARIIDAVAKRLHADRDKFPTNLERVGNMSSASIPVFVFVFSIYTGSNRWLCIDHVASSSHKVR